MITVIKKVHKQEYRGYTARCKQLVRRKNRMGRLLFAKKYLKEQPQFWKKVFWTDETKMNLYQSDDKSKVWRREGTAQEPMHTTSSVKHSGEGVKAWACMAAEDTGSLIFIDDITTDGSSKINSVVYGHILSAQIQGMPQN